jgi:transposase-like protein
MAYTEQFRAEALVTLEANGGNIKQTAIQLEIGEATLHRWIEENSRTGDNKSDIAIATTEIIPDTRETFIAELKTLRNKVLRHLDGIVEDLKAREAAITLGILIDKTELLEGNATSRTAVVGGGETVDEAITRLSAELESRPNRFEIPQVASSPEGDSAPEPTTP